MPEAGLKRPGTFDYMTYCNPTWVSDYYFAKSLDHLSRPGRGVQASRLPAAQVLVLWGSARDGDLRLEPPLALEAPVKRPTESGPYSLTGFDEGGRHLFSFDFTPDQTDHGGSVFVFAIPFEQAWAASVDRITLSGPEGSRTVDRQAIDRAAVVVDRASGRVRSIVRDWPQTLPGVLGDAAAVSVRRGLARLEETR